jgi:hypothetical protein
MIAGFPRPVIEREGLPGRLSRFQFASMKSISNSMRISIRTKGRSPFIRRRRL